MNSANSKVRVLIVDDHPVVRVGLKTMLESDGRIDVVALAASAREAISEVQRTLPEVVLMDLRMPGMEGTEAIVHLRRSIPDIRILVLTNYDAEEYIFRALRNGAMGYLLKSTPQEEIIRAVEMVREGKRCIPPAIAQRLSETLAREELSQRELEVLGLVAKGYTNKQVAAELFISDKTARNHVTNCMVKLGANDRTEAVTTAISRGLIRVPDEAGISKESGHGCGKR